jgi:putative membrane protein
MALLDDRDKARIEAAIGELEKRTAAEVVVAVVPHSGRPFFARALVALSFGLAAALAFLERLPALDPRWSLSVEMAVALVCFALLGLRPLERWLVSPRLAGPAVQEHAFAIFARRGLHRTRGHTGVLILLSELERRAVMLGDEGIHARLGQEGWQAHVDRIVLAIKRGAPADGLVDVLARLTDVLAELAPVSGPNDDELPNAVLEET